MNSEVHRFSARQRKLRPSALVVVLALLPLITLSEEDAAQTTYSSRFDDDPQASSDNAISLLDDHANIFAHTAEFFETLTQANEDELLELLEDSRDTELGNVRDEKILAIASRFALIDPQAALAKFNELVYEERDPFLKGIFSEWCVLNLDEAIATAATLNRSERLTVFKAIVSVRDDLTEAQLNAIARQLGHSDFATDFESDSKTIEFADDPITAWNVLVNDGQDDFSQLDNLILVAETMIEEKGLDALFHLYEPFDVGFRIIGETYVFDEVLNAIVTSDPQNTWEYIKSGSTRPLDQSLDTVNAQDKNTFSPREQAYMTDRVQYLLITRLG